MQKGINVICIWMAARFLMFVVHNSNHCIGEFVKMFPPLIQVYWLDSLSLSVRRHSGFIEQFLFCLIEQNQNNPMSQCSLFNSRHYQLLLWFRLCRYTNSILSTMLLWGGSLLLCCAGFCKLFLWVISTNTYIRPDSSLQKCQKLFSIHDSARRPRRLEIIGNSVKPSTAIN